MDMKALQAILTNAEESLRLIDLKLGEVAGALKRRNTIERGKLLAKLHHGDCSPNPWFVEVLAQIPRERQLNIILRALGQKTRPAESQGGE
jgi:hypothetical protein